MLHYCKMNNEKEFILSFAKNLRAIRKQKGYTQESLAEKSGVSESLIARIETGVVNTTIGVVNTLATALEVHSSELFKF